MALSISTYPNPYDPANAMANAFAYIAFLALDASNDTGRLVLNIHPNATAANSGAQPVSQLSVTLGQITKPGTPSTNPDGSPGPITGQVNFPRLDELLADQAFASAFRTIQAKLETLLISQVVTNAVEVA